MFMERGGYWGERKCKIVTFPFLAHLSWKLKRAFLIACRPSSVWPSGRLAVNFSQFNLLLQKHFANFNKTWHKASLGEEDSILFKWRVKPFSCLFSLTKSQNTLRKFSSPEPLCQFQPSLAQSILGWRGFNFVQIKALPFIKER